MINISTTRKTSEIKVHKRDRDSSKRLLVSIKELQVLQNQEEP